MLSAACALAVIAQAQNVIVVDIEGRPGFHFREIQPAIDAAKAGDVIRVRASASMYTGFTVGKALRILGEPGVVVHGVFPGQAMEVQGITAGEVVVLSNLRERVTDPLAAGLRIRENAGAVHARAISGTYFVIVEDSAQVSFDRCALQSIDVQSSTVAFVDTSATGSTLYVASAGLDISDSRVTIAGGTWMGACSQPLSSPAIMMSGESTLVITGDASTSIRGSGPGVSCGSSAAIRATGGTIVLSPDPLIVPAGSSMPIFGTATIVGHTTPYLRTSLDGGDLVAAVSGTAGAMAFLMTSPFTGPVPLPVPLPDLWTGEPIIVAAGPVPVAAPRVDRIAVPAFLPPGSALPFQSAIVSGALELSNPAVSVLVP